MTQDCGRPIDFMLWKLERAADARGKKLEDFSGYIQLCHILTESDDGEPLDWRTKEWCYKKLYSLVDWVMIGDCITTSEWVRLSIKQWHEMNLMFQSGQL